MTLRLQPWLRDRYAVRIVCHAATSGLQHDCCDAVVMLTSYNCLELAVILLYVFLLDIMSWISSCSLPHNSFITLYSLAGILI